MSVKTESNYRGEFILSEEEVSRDNIVILSGENVVAGQALGKVSLGAGAFAALGTNVGACTCGAITVGLGALPGVYTIEMDATSATGAFRVEDPLGNEIGHGNVGTAFSAGGIGFTISNGGTNTVGDSYTITVAAGSGKYRALAAANTDGSAVWAGFAYGNYDATAADVNGVAIARIAEVKSDLLNWGTLNGGQITTATAQAQAANVFIRTAK